jgi:hypothetical protein
VGADPDVAGDTSGAGADNREVDVDGVRPRALDAREKGGEVEEGVWSTPRSLQTKRYRWCAEVENFRDKRPDP